MAHRRAAAHTHARARPAWGKAKPCTRHDVPLRKDLSECAIAFLTDAYLILKLNSRPVARGTEVLMPLILCVM